MAESKANVALGVSMVAVVAAGASFAYTNSQVSPLEERLRSVEEDLLKLAQLQHEARSVQETMASTTKEKIKSVEKRLTKLEKKTKDNSAVCNELSEIKEELCSILEHLGSSTIPNLPIDTSSLSEPTPKRTTRKTKKSHKKKHQEEPEEEPEEDDDTLKNYIAKKKNKTK